MNRGKDEQADGDDLGDRDHAAEVEAARHVAPVYLDNESEDGVEDGIEPEYLTIEFPVPVDREKNKKIEELPSRLKELGREESTPSGARERASVKVRQTGPWQAAP